MVKPPSSLNLDPEQTSLSIKNAWWLLSAAVAAAISATVWVVTVNFSNRDTLKALDRLEKALEEGSKKSEIALTVERADRKSDNADRKLESQKLENAIHDLSDTVQRVFSDTVQKSLFRDWITRQILANQGKYPDLTWCPMEPTEAGYKPK